MQRFSGKRKQAKFMKKALTKKARAVKRLLNRSVNLSGLQ